MLFLVTNKKHYFILRQQIQTLWTTAKLSTSSFQPACVSTLDKCPMPTSFLSSTLIICLVPCLACVFRLPYFDVQPANGSVYVKNQTLLDREVRSLYTATLQATDTDGKAGTTLLEITLTDVNDKNPVINRETYFEFVPEGQQFELLIQVKQPT